MNSVTAHARRTEVPLGALVFLVGAGTLGAEIGAVRLLAPFFGASTFIWANTIAVVLVSLAIGYWLGGGWATRHPTRAALDRLVLAAGVAIALVPFAARPLLALAVRAFDAISVGAFLASLFAVLALVAIPLTMLGAVSPWAIRLAVRRVEEAGRTTGHVYALVTVGSLVGTFAAALLLVPMIGSQRTFVVFGLILALAASVGLARWRLVPAALAALLAVPVGTIKGGDGERVLAERETEYQYARVVDTGGRRDLELNEGRAVHSTYRPGTVLTEGVWDGYLVVPFASLRRPPRRLAILGGAAGTTIRAYGRYFPHTRVDAVEIDPELYQLGKRYFGLRASPQVRLYGDDARPFLRRSGRRYDAIFVDAYRQPYIPFYLTTREFFALARARLAPGGALIVNIGHPAGSEDLERVVSATLASVFPRVLRDPIEVNNTLLLASAAPAGRDLLRAASSWLPPDLRSLARESATRLGTRLPGGSVYTDDRAPVEWLVDRSIVQAAAHGGE